MLHVTMCEQKVGISGTGTEGPEVGLVEQVSRRDIRARLGLHYRKGLTIVDSVK